MKSAIARSGFLFRWTVIDFDAGGEYQGLAADQECAQLEAMTKVKEIRASDD